MPSQPNLLRTISQPNCQGPTRQTEAVTYEKYIVVPWKLTGGQRKTAKIPVGSKYEDLAVHVGPILKKDPGKLRILRMGKRLDITAVALPGVRVTVVTKLA